MQFALTYHIEGPRERLSAEIYDEIAAQVILADRLGFDIAWFSEHHAHIHLGHAPFPLLLALHLAGRTERIHLGTAVICLNLHNPLQMAEQIAMADVLTGGRISPGFGSGSTPSEYALFGIDPGDAARRHARFAAALDLLVAAWSGAVPAWSDDWYQIPAHAPLPVPAPDLVRRVWIAANSTEAAAICGAKGFSLMLSRERSVEQYQTLIAAYVAALTARQSNKDAQSGAPRPETQVLSCLSCASLLNCRVSVSRSMYVGHDDATAEDEAGPALWELWRRMKRERKAPADAPDPTDFATLARRTNFIAGGPDTCRKALEALYTAAPFTNFNLQPRWEGMSQPVIIEGLRRFAGEVMPALREVAGKGRSTG
jgi:alkanesulfonate monooxygenase SsuD/methylene tetrahydromethanopterin reductase-like flavin-dependent oxidoreductase (luciferase family)